MYDQYFEARFGWLLFNHFLGSYEGHKGQYIADTRSLHRPHVQSYGHIR